MKQMVDKFQQDGVVIGLPLFTAEQVEECNIAFDEVMNWKYETGVEPRFDNLKPGEEMKGRLRQIKDTHLSNTAIHNFLNNRKLGEWAARLIGAKRLAIFTTQQLYKPYSGSKEGIIGWHRDRSYINDSITAWISLSDVKENSGPVVYVKGSHLWGDMGNTQFFYENDLEQIEKIIQERTVSDIPIKWEEVAGVMPTGCVSFHHCDTLHASRNNFSDVPRRSFAVHMCPDTSPKWEQQEGSPRWIEIYNENK
jgi:hypothetical protein